LDIQGDRYLHCDAFSKDAFSVVEYVLNKKSVLIRLLIRLSTIGAGDTFIAGALYGQLNLEAQWDCERVLLFANELAGRKVVQEGFSGLGKAMQGAVE
jgi:fructose-1-phosphate kinase PfkB-like protein